MRIVIAGCGRVGSDLALTFAEDGNDVSVIDHRTEMFRRLGSTFDGTIHEGLSYDIELLQEAGIEYADAFVAVTDSDNSNLMAVQIAKQFFGVPKTIARLDDPRRADSYRALDVEYIAGAKLASRVIYEEIVNPEFHYHVTFAGGDVEIVEMLLGKRANDVTVADLEVQGQLRVAAVRRDTLTHIPDPAFTLREDDLVVAAAREGVLSKVRRYIKHPEDE